MKIKFENTEYNLPDFLIVGAAKSGTTSMHNYLKKHPDIFLPEDKEPYFFSFWNNDVAFNSPDKLLGVVNTLDTYGDIFRDASENQLIGDASPSYLYTYKKTIENIYKLYGDNARKLKIIVILREGSSRAWSQFMHFKKYDNEPLSYEDAFKSETINKRLSNRWNVFYDYIGFSKYSEAISAYKASFDHVSVYLFDDLKKDATIVVSEILAFLNLSDEIESKALSKKHNISGKPKNGISKAIWKLMYQNNPLKSLAAKLVPKSVKKKIFASVSSKILEQEKIPEDLQRKLKPEFKEDVERLEAIINKDLSPWKSE